MNGQGAFPSNGISVYTAHTYTHRQTDTHTHRYYLRKGCLLYTINKINIHKQLTLD